MSIESGETYQESDDLEKEASDNKPYDALIVFGFGAKPRTVEERDQGLNEEGWHLTTGTKARLLAAGEMYKMGQVNRVILSEGAPPGSEKTGGELMKEYLMYKFPEIPEESIIVEDKATNTIENFSYVVDTLDRLGILKAQEEQSHIAKPRSNIALLSNRFHLARIHQIAERFGVKGDGFNAEDILELAAKEKEETSGRPVVSRFERWHSRMSTPEGNDAWRDPNEIARRIYVACLASLARKAEMEGDNEKKRYITTLLSKTWLPELRSELDDDLRNLGEDVEGLHASLEQRLKQLEINAEDRSKEPSYNNYLKNENRWSYGMTDLPEYWLFQAAKVSSPRFLKILSNSRNVDALRYLEGIGYKNPLGMNEEEFDAMRKAISSDEYIKNHRKTPPEFDEKGPLS